MPTKYYKKTHPSRKLLSKSGRYITFETVNQDTGLLVTSDPIIIAEIDYFIGKQSGGVMEITQEQHDDILKKKTDLNSSSNSLRDQNRASGLITNGVADAAGVAAEYSLQHINMRFDDQRTRGLTEAMSPKPAQPVASPNPIREPSRVQHAPRTGKKADVFS